MGTLPPSIPESGSNAAPQSTKITVGPLSIEAALPKWATATLSASIVLLLLISGGGVGYLKFKPMLAEARAREDAAKGEVHVPIDLMQIYQETQNHHLDAPEDQEQRKETLTTDGIVTIHHYFKDGCVEIIRQVPGKKPEQKWMFGPNVNLGGPNAPKLKKDAKLPIERYPPSSPNREDTSFDPPSLEQLGDHNLREAVENAIYSAQKPAKLTRVQYPPHCIDPHPGAFTYNNQQINQCLIQVNRFFEDGCSHFQLFNPCNGSWDVRPDGNPKVTWMRCVH